MIIKEGMTEKDQKTKEACIQFLRNSIIQEKECTINISDLIETGKKVKNLNSMRRKSSLISKNYQNSQSSTNNDPNNRINS